MYVKTPEGWLVDPETGLVVSEEEAVVVNEPEYRAYDAEERISREHYAPMNVRRKTKRERIEQVLDAGGIPRGADYGYVVRNLGFMGAGESNALEIGGFTALIVFRCLRALGLAPDTALKLLMWIYQGRPCNLPRNVKQVALGLHKSIIQAKTEALAKWISKPKLKIDVDLAAKIMRTDVKKGAVKQVIAEVKGLKVQITSGKVDVSAKVYERDRVITALMELSRRLGVELSSPEVVTITMVVRFPFNVSPSLLARAEIPGVAIVDQGYRVKLVFEKCVALVGRNAATMYVKPKNMEIESAMNVALARCLPIVCLAASIPNNKSNKFPLVVG